MTIYCSCLDPVDKPMLSKCRCFQKPMLSKADAIKSRCFLHPGSIWFGRRPPWYWHSREDVESVSGGGRSGVSSDDRSSIRWKSSRCRLRDRWGREPLGSTIHDKLTTLTLDNAYAWKSWKKFHQSLAQHFINHFVWLKMKHQATKVNKILEIFAPPNRYWIQFRLNTLYQKLNAVQDIVMLCDEGTNIQVPQSAIRRGLKKKKKEEVAK